MTPNESLSPAASARTKRPLLFFFLMVLCVVMGWGGVVSGCNTLQYYHSSTLYDPPMNSSPNVTEYEERVVFLRALQTVFDSARSVRLPLSVANFLLSALLVLAASRLLKGRRDAVSLGYQALLANALLTAVDYLVARHMRRDVIATFAARFPRGSFRGGPSPLTDSQIADLLSNVGWATARAQLVLSLALYGFSALQLARASTQAFLLQGERRPEAPTPED